jgi:hypothetical protein
MARACQVFAYVALTLLSAIYAFSVSILSSPAQGRRVSARRSDEVAMGGVAESTPNHHGTLREQTRADQLVGLVEEHARRLRRRSFLPSAEATHPPIDVGWNPASNRTPTVTATSRMPTVTPMAVGCEAHFGKAPGNLRATCATENSASAWFRTATGSPDKNRVISSGSHTSSTTDRIALPAFDDTIRTLLELNRDERTLRRSTAATSESS